MHNFDFDQMGFDLCLFVHADTYHLITKKTDVEVPFDLLSHALCEIGVYKKDSNQVFDWIAKDATKFYFKKGELVLIV
jgi:hypothetical protein